MVLHCARAEMKWFILCCLGLAVSRPVAGKAEDWAHFGPLLDQFKLTLDPGERTEALGPFYYSERKDTQKTWAVPPLFSLVTDATAESEEYDFLYPLLTYDRYGAQYRWQFLQLFSFAGGPTQTETHRRRFTIYPIYFQQRSADTNENYTALLPFYGHLKNRLYRDEIFFVTPFYAVTRKKDIVTDNYFYPFVHVRRGDGLTGWQFWPFVGAEHKTVTTATNLFGDVSLVPGHDWYFGLWPFYHNEYSNLGTTNEEHRQGVLPFYNVQRSPNRDMSTVLWPFFSRIDDREKKYLEWQLPWPIIGFARGEGKTMNRVIPFYSHAQSPTDEEDSYLWPVFHYSRLRADPLDRERWRILYFLYSDTRLKNSESGKFRRRTDFWPLFNYSRGFDGRSRLQILAPLEPFIPTNKSIERNYSPLWSLWLAQCDPAQQTASQSLLWNLYRHESGPGSGHWSALFGLVQHETRGTNGRWRLFFVPLGRAPEKYIGAKPGAGQSFVAVTPPPTGLAAIEP